jgi:curli biogenesis system outer membrane secretion channel CsgG
MRRLPWCAVALIVALAMQGCAGRPKAPPEAAAPVEAAQKPAPRPPARMVPVAIDEFRSQASAVSTQSAMDMFITALVESRQFTVIERYRREDFRDGGSNLLRARYLIRGAVTEFTEKAEVDDLGVKIGASGLGGSRVRDVIAIDVRILDERTGVVLHALSVKRGIDSAQVDSKWWDVFSFGSKRREGVDSALRALMKEAAEELGRRIGQRE